MKNDDELIEECVQKITINKTNPVIYKIVREIIALVRKHDKRKRNKSDQENEK